MSEPFFLPNDFDAFVNTALNQWQVPGVAIGIVKDDAVVFAKGYGVKKMGERAPIDERTIFGIGSTTKAFTAAVVAALVGDGKLNWDDPVCNYLPGFRLRDPWVTRAATLRDLLCHRLGLPRGVMMRLRSDCDLATYLERMNKVQPLYSFRSRYNYTNTSFDWAGQAAAVAAGTTWRELVQRRIFDPLGMKSSSTNVAGLNNAANVVTPHAHLNGELRTIPRRDVGDDPAGSINSNLLDMLQWVRMQLGKGNYGGVQVLAPQTVYEMHAPQIAIPHPEDTEIGSVLMLMNPDISFWTYGLGWFVICYRGKKMVWHGGQITGHGSMVVLFPEENLGFVILTNIHETLLHAALVFTLADAYLGFARDWNGDFLRLNAQATAQMQAARAQIADARIKDTAPSLPLDQYVGAYTSEWCGDAQIAAGDAGLILHYGGAPKADLDHWHYDTFRLTWRDPIFPPELVTFTIDARGRVDKMGIPSLTEFTREG